MKTRVLPKTDYTKKINFSKYYISQHVSRCASFFNSYFEGHATVILEV